MKRLFYLFILIILISSCANLQKTAYTDELYYIPEGSNVSEQQQGSNENIVEDKDSLMRTKETSYDGFADSYNQEEDEYYEDENYDVIDYKNRLLVFHDVYYYDPYFYTDPWYVYGYSPYGYYPRPYIGFGWAGYGWDAYWGWSYNPWYYPNTYMWYGYNPYWWGNYNPYCFYNYNYNTANNFSQFDQRQEYGNQTGTTHSGTGTVVGKNTNGHSASLTQQSQNNLTSENGGKNNRPYTGKLNANTQSNSKPTSTAVSKPRLTSPNSLTNAQTDSRNTMQRLAKPRLTNSGSHSWNNDIIKTKNRAPIINQNRFVNTVTNTGTNGNRRPNINTHSRPSYKPGQSTRPSGGQTSPTFRPRGSGNSSPTIRNSSSGKRSSRTLGTSRPSRSNSSNSGTTIRSSSSRNNSSNIRSSSSGSKSSGSRSSGSSSPRKR